MLDPKFIRENLDKVREAVRKKHSIVDLDKFVELDDERKKIQTELDEKRAEQNKASQKIAQANVEEREKMIAEVGSLKEEVKKLEEKIKPVLEEWQNILMNIPNIVSSEVPDGKDDTENITVKTWGEIPEFDFEPKTHDVLGKELDLIDTEKAAEVSGSRFYYLKGDLVLLQFALTQYAFETLTNEKIIKKVLP